MTAAGICRSLFKRHYSDHCYSILVKSGHSTLVSGNSFKARTKHINTDPNPNPNRYRRHILSGVHTPRFRSHVRNSGRLRFRLRAAINRLPVDSTDITREDGPDFLPSNLISDHTTLVLTQRQVLPELMIGFLMSRLSMLMQLKARFPLPELTA